MGKRVVDDASLSAIADTIRSLAVAFRPELEEMLFPDGFEAGVHKVYNQGIKDGTEAGFEQGRVTGEREGIEIGKNQGRAEGLAEGAAICAAQHFIHNFVGEGTSSVSFHVPFEPDMVQIIGFDPTFNKKPYALGSFTYDRRAFGMMGGTALYDKADGGVASTYYTTTSALNRYSRTEDGTITIGNFSSSVPIEFSLGYVYTIIAVKYTEQTDQERITAFVEGLTGSGTVTLNKVKVEAAFTDDEWAALVATKPGWTFAWI